LGLSKTTSFWAKRRSFANFMIFFFMKKRRKLKIKKKGGGEKSGWLEPPLAQKMGWPDHPIFGQGVASHPIPAVWGWPKPPQAFGGGPATPKGQKKKKKKKTKKTKKMGLGFWGWPDHPLGPGGGFGHHLPVVRGGRSHPQALGGGPATPKIPNPFFSFFSFFFFFFVLAFRGGRTTPKGAWGGFGHPHTAGIGWPATPWPKMGWSGHPIFWARGGSSHPDFSLFFFFFFLISFFFSLKKNPKICKTTPFWTSPKQRSFGVEGIMGIYIFIY
jgi:hypothetical protein